MTKLLIGHVRGIRPSTASFHNSATGISLPSMENHAGPSNAATGASMEEPQANKDELSLHEVVIYAVKLPDVLLTTLEKLQTETDPKERTICQYEACMIIMSLLDRASPVKGPSPRDCMKQVMLYNWQPDDTRLSLWLTSFIPNVGTPPQRAHLPERVHQLETAHRQLSADHLRLAEKYSILEAAHAEATLALNTIKSKENKDTLKTQRSHPDPSTSIPEDQHQLTRFPARESFNSTGKGCPEGELDPASYDFEAKLKEMGLEYNKDLVGVASHPEKRTCPFGQRVSTLHDEQSNSQEDEELIYDVELAELMAQQREDIMTLLREGFEVLRFA